MSEVSIAQLEARVAVRQRQRFVWTLAGSVVPVIAAAAFLWITLQEVNEAQGDLALSNTDLAEARTRLAATEDEINDRQEELTRLNVELDSAQAAIDGANAQLVQGRPELAGQILSESPVAPSQISPRVYIHVRSTAQIAASNEIADTLRLADFVIPDAEILTDIGPNTTQLRYFKRSEEETAQRILEILQAESANEPWELQYTPGYEDSAGIRPLHFELWFRQEAFL